MKKQTALKAILGISIAGILFSGFLSYNELFVGQASCGVSSGINLGLPACVYGFIMYTIVFIIALLGLKTKR